MGKLLHFEDDNGVEIYMEHTDMNGWASVTIRDENMLTSKCVFLAPRQLEILHDWIEKEFIKVNKK